MIADLIVPPSMLWDVKPEIECKDKDAQALAQALAHGETITTKQLREAMLDALKFGTGAHVIYDGGRRAGKSMMTDLLAQAKRSA